MQQNEKCLSFQFDKYYLSLVHGKCQHSMLRSMQSHSRITILDDKRLNKMRIDQQLIAPFSELESYHSGRST